MRACVRASVKEFVRLCVKLKVNKCENEQRRREKKTQIAAGILFWLRIHLIRGFFADRSLHLF